MNASTLQIMQGGATKSFEQAHNAQAGVDCDSQIIVNAGVTQAGNDKQQFVPMVEQIEENLGEIPDRVLADSGYFSTDNMEYVDGNFMEPFICRDRTKPCLAMKTPGLYLHRASLILRDAVKQIPWPSPDTGMIAMQIYAQSRLSDAKPSSSTASGSSRYDLCQDPQFGSSRAVSCSTPAKGTKKGKVQTFP